MERRKIHAQGPTFSRIIAGAWRWHTVSPETVERLALVALENGITSFDHADIYGDHSNEEIFGRALVKNPSLRNKMELITKCDIKFQSAKRPATWVKHYDTSKEHIIWSVENSLKMFHTDRLDLLLIQAVTPVQEAHLGSRQDGSPVQNTVLHGFFRHAFSRCFHSFGETQVHWQEKLGKAGRDCRARYTAVRLSVAGNGRLSSRGN